MSNETPDPRQRKFDESLERWASRPPKQEAGEAARQILRRLPVESRASQIWWPGPVAVAAALVLALGARFFLVTPGVTPDPGLPGVTLGQVAAPPVPEGVAVVWIDPETPLYLTLEVPAPPKGNPQS